MDTLTGLLESPKARGAFLLKSVFQPPWGMRIEDRAPLSVVTMLHGDAWVLPDRGRPLLLRPRDVAVLRGPDAYTIADHPDTEPRIVVGPEQRCQTTDGQDVTERMALGVRTWGQPDRAGSSVMLSGTYQAPSEIGARILSALPVLLVRPASAGADPLVGVLAEEIDKDEVGQEIVLDRLLDLLLINVLRTWLADPESGAPPWFRAQSDPVVGPALRRLHEQPHLPWTVASLADSVGVSRAGLARHFTQLVGEPPMSYLTGWRLTLAADMLRDPDATVASVARRVGYSGAFALSAAFKRVRGVSPQEFRKGVGRRTVRPTGLSPQTVVLDR
ncbi:AraC family transcriptional regulator [Streptomyces sp. KM273126]|uniref:AraC family transcriptional regulator n=1 Tax=Streptomyces sp. KM273126 TaxID=2545247 RepID=UPI00103FD61B|nr:AraC family transcriptional regulator [Streptomyces sp. KM273126]MBA2809552.1 AraC family transcriptional regulator [Streptomyces sp. KM273126]